MSISRQVYLSRIEQTVTYIQENLAAPLDLRRVAQAGHYSPFHFHRIFTAVIGETPQDFINRLRLEKAANLLLKSPSLTITQVAVACGFSSSSTFARSFKKYFGVSASQYVEHQGSKAVLPSLPSLKLPEATFVLEFDMQIQLRWMPHLHLAYIANLKGYSLSAICRAWRRIYRWAAARELITTHTQMIGISFDDPLITAEDKCRYYACLTVPENLSSDPMVGFLDIPEGRYAICQVTCRAEQISQAYRALYRDWLPDSGLEPQDFPCYEIYHQTPETHPEGKYRMDICIPVAAS